MKIHALTPQAVSRRPVPAAPPPPAPDQVELSAPASGSAGLARTGMETAASLAGFQGRNRWEWWFIKGPWRDCEASRAKEIRRPDGPWMDVRQGLQDAAASYTEFEKLHQGARSFQGPWTALQDLNLGHAWDDSPDQPYGPRENRSLTSSPLSLNGLSGCQLHFKTRYDLENGYDAVDLEASQDGRNWKTLKHYTGAASLSDQQVDLAAYDGGTVQLRFRLTSDGSTQREGMLLGGLSITGRDASGGERKLGVDAGDPDQDRARLQEVASGLAPEQRLAGLWSLGYLAERLGTSGQALALWPAVEQMLDRPDLESRLQELLALSALTGAAGANQVWHRLNGREAGERKQDLDSIRSLAAEFQPAGAVRLWSVYDAAAPDAAERLHSLTEMARALGPELAAPAYQSLEGKPGSWERRAQASVAAHRLHQLGHSSQPAALYERIHHLPPAELAEMDGLAEHLTRGWRAEGSWGRTEELRWGPVWSDSPNGPYPANANYSLTSSPLDLRGLTGAEVRMTAAWELESNYDKMHLECSQDGKEWSELRTFTGKQATPTEVRVPLNGFQRGFLRLRLTSDGSTQMEGLRFSDFAIVSQQGVRRLEQPWEQAGPRLEKLLTTVLKAEQPAATLGALARSARELGDGDRAMAVWPDLQKELGKPDFEQRRAFVTELANRGGAEAARETWQQCAGLDEAGRQAVLSKMDQLVKQGVARGEAVWLAGSLAPHLGQPDLAAREGELLKLSSSVGARAAARAANELERLDAGRPWQERAGLYQSARRLLLTGGEEPAREEILALYGRLKALPTAQATQLAALGEQAAFTVQAEKPWTPIPGGWSDSPDSDYPSNASGSLTLSEISLQGLSQPQLSLRGGYELENSYDTVTVEGKRPGRDWEAVHRFTGQAPVQDLRVDLSAFQGERVQLRLRFKSDGSTQMAGMDFTHLAVRGTETSTGQDVVLMPSGSPPAGLRKQLIETVLASPDPSRSLQLVARGSQTLGSLEGGLALHQRASSDPSSADRELALMSQFGLELSARLAPLVKSDADLAALQRLAAEAGPRADVLQLWKGLGAGPELEERAACLGALAQASDSRTALMAMKQLAQDTARPWAERRQLYSTAMAVGQATDQEASRLYGALGQLSPTSVQSLGELAAQAQRQWTPSGSWAQEVKPGWGRVWSDSPGGQYQPNTDSSLTSTPLSLHGMTGVRAELQVQYELEKGYDSVTLEVETARGWKPLKQFTGSQPGADSSLDMSEYDGQDVRLRMRMKSDGSTQMEGFSFRGLKLVSNERTLEMASAPLDKRALRTFVDSALKQGDESCRLLSDLAREVGDLGEALTLFRVIEPERDRPDFAKTRQALTELVATLGGAGALERYSEFLTGTGEERLQRVRSYRLAADMARRLGQDQNDLYERLRGSTLTSGCCEHMRQMAARDNFEALLALGTEAGRPPERRERTLEMLASLGEAQRQELLAALDLAARAGKLNGGSAGDVAERAIPIMLLGNSASQAVEQALLAGLTGIRETEDQVIVGGVVVRRKSEAQAASGEG